MRLSDSEFSFHLNPQSAGNKYLVAFSIVVRLHLPLVTLHFEATVTNPMIDSEVEVLHYLFLLDRDL